MRNLYAILFLAFLAICGYTQSDLSDRIDAYGKLQSGSYIEAIRVFNDMDASGNLKSKDRLSLGIAQFYNRDFAAARKNFQMVSEEDFADANLWMARIYAENRNSDDALLYIERYLKTSKNPDITGIQKDTCFRFMHPTDKWFNLWQNEWYSDIQKIIQEADFYSRRNNYKASHQVLENAISTNIAHTELYYANAKVFLIEQNPALALDALNQAIRLEPASASYYKERARCFELMGNFESALDDLNKAISIDPVDFDTRFIRARAAMNAGNYELAEKDISLYMQYFSSEESLFLAGQIYYASEDYFNALKYYNKLIKEAKPNSNYFKGRGLAYFQSGTYFLASKDLSMSLDLDPDNAETNFYMGSSEYYNGNTKAACYYWEKAKDMGELKAVDYLQKYCK